jgi:hypothetical protein
MIETQKSAIEDRLEFLNDRMLPATVSRSKICSPGTGMRWPRFNAVTARFSFAASASARRKTSALLSTCGLRAACGTTLAA